MTKEVTLPNGKPGVRMTLKEIAPDTCPDGFEDLPGADIGYGMIYPLGSVANHFIEMQRELEKKMEANSQRLYFIQVGDHGPIKIGTANDVHSRLKNLQCASPCELRVVREMDGGKRLEGAAHKRFAAQHIRGEWFAITERQAKEFNP